MSGVEGDVDASTSRDKALAPPNADSPTPAPRALLMKFLLLKLISPIPNKSKSRDAKAIQRKPFARPPCYLERRDRLTETTIRL